MDDEFEIHVTFSNQELKFPAKLLNYGYSYKIEVTIIGTNVLFELDEERKWRASINYDDLNANKKINKELLESIASTLDEILKN